MTRAELLFSFLEQNHWETAKRIPLASDASSRTYERLIMGEKQAILMNSPLSERPDQFAYIDKLLRQAGIHAPEIMAFDAENGFMLLEDFGDQTFTRLLQQGADELDLYRQGIDTLIRLQQKINLPIKGVDLYSFERLMREVLLLPNWFGKYVVGGLSDQAVAEFTEIWKHLIQPLTDLPQSLVLLDYHADNLMITPGGDCGVLDFQDARIGPAIYDLMSLLEDERRDVSAEVRNNLIAHYFAARPEIDTPFVRECLPVMAMQRHTKVIGIFVRLYMRDKKEKYLKMIPLVWELTERHLSNPVFADYRKWLNTYIPKNLRHSVFQPTEDLQCSP